MSPEQAGKPSPPVAGCKPALHEGFARIYFTGYAFADTSFGFQRDERQNQDLLYTFP